MVEDLIFERLTSNTALISIAGSKSPSTGAGFPSMEAWRLGGLEAWRLGGLEGEDECDRTEVGKGNHFLFA